MFEEISHGFWRADCKRKGKSKCSSKHWDMLTTFIPPPPVDIIKDTTKDKGILIGYHRIKEIGKLKRGEPWSPLNGEMVMNGIVGTDRDIYKILAYVIYGCTRRRAFVARSVEKYLDIYEVIEKTYFIPFIGRCENSQEKLVSIWKMFKAFVTNRDLKVTKIELYIIARLYGIELRMFKKTVEVSNKVA